MPPDPFTGIPADIQAFRDGWTEITDHGHPYEVVLARDFSDDYLAERICGTFRNMGDKVTSSLVSLGKEVSRASILELLLGDVAIVRLEQFTTEMLVKRNFPPLVPYEYREFLYTRWYRSRFNLSNDKSFSHFMPPLSKSLDIIIMDPHRFATIQSCTRGFSQAGRTGSEDSDVWMEAGAMLRKLNELEVAIFSRSASNLLNHGNGSIVVDDELIASRASDVEQKVVSNRKAGKEGPVADCIACALSSVLLGMRLRVKNDPENVEQLLHTLPLSTASGNDLEVAFDRGYGKLSSVEAIASRNLHVVTVAGTLGSRHPFNTPDEWISTLNKWKTKRGVDQQKILSWTLLCENWNLRGDPMLGEEVRIAERTKVGEKPIYAIALREVFDRKNPVKYLKFFASKNHRPYTFVAVERNEHLDQNVLFSPKTPSPERSSVEQALLQSAQPLTVGQRCADWFLMKSMLLSGTMAGKIGTYEAEPSGAALSSIMEECIVSWFGRHKSTAMMASGTRNENPTLDRLRSSVKCMKGIFEVGLLRWNRNHAIGVSPDAICRLVVEDAPDPVLCCLEIKTRVSESTIAKAELARKKHGSFVNCYYGDAVFNDCVPAANRSQVLHQALVTGFQHGVFVVCKLEEGQGSIVQIVAIRISTEKRDEYAKNLCKVVNPLLGFLHNEDVIARGILMDSDFPDWVTDPQRTILKTRAKLYYGHLKLITTEEGDLRPTSQCQFTSIQRSIATTSTNQGMIRIRKFRIG